VVAVLSDVERWPEWTPSVRSIQRLDGGPLASGKKARICQPKLPPADCQVTALHEGSSFTWVTRSPGLSVTARHEVKRSEGGSRATLSVQFEGGLGPLVGWLTRGLNDRYLKLEAAGLKRRSEETRSKRIAAEGV
jgi:Polyketide cyclase / dehydrase and lipid transport